MWLVCCVVLVVCICYFLLVGFVICGLCWCVFACVTVVCLVRFVGVLVSLGWFGGRFVCYWLFVFGDCYFSLLVLRVLWCLTMLLWVSLVAVILLAGGGLAW